MDTIGARIRRARESAGFRQEDLAEKTGIMQKTISNYENGVSYPNSLNLTKISDVLDVSADWLLGRTEDRFSATARAAAQLITELDEEDQRFIYSMMQFSVNELRVWKARRH